MEKLLIQAGFIIGDGTRSDISHMQSLGVACFNVGIGFHHELYPDCWANLAILNRQLDRFEEFYRINKSCIFEDES